MPHLISSLLDPVPVEFRRVSTEFNIEKNILKNIVFFEPSHKEIETELCILGLPEERNSESKGLEKAPNAIRKYFYGLSWNWKNDRITDLGNLKKMSNVKEAYSGLEFLIDELLGEGKTIILLGGSQELSIPVYKALDKKKESPALFFLDSLLDFSEKTDNLFSSKSYLQEINHNTSDLIVAGIQRYFVERESHKILSENSEIIRLSQVRENINEMEPYLRDAVYASFDACSIRMANSPSEFPNPNGLYGEEFCKISRYAGLGEKNCCFGLFGFNPLKDEKSESIMLAAQAVWHYLEGFYSRFGDNPLEKKKKYKQYIVHHETLSSEMIFIQNKQNNRWWFVFDGKDGRRYFSCSESEYLKAKKNDIPERWLYYFKKLANN